MIELRLMDCNWIQYQNLHCKTLVRMCEVLVEMGVPDQAWTLHKGREMCTSGLSIYAVADINLPKYYTFPLENDET